MTLGPAKRTAIALTFIAKQLLGCAEVSPDDGDLPARADDPAPGAQIAAVPLPVFGEPRLRGKGCDDPTKWQIDRVGGSLKDGSAFSIWFEEFSAQLGPGHKLDASTTHCNIAIPIESAVPLQYAVVTFTYRGTALLQPGTRLDHHVEYWFLERSSLPLDGRPSESQIGPFGRNFIYKDDLTARSPDQLNWSACSKQANLLIDINEQLTASTPQELTSHVNVQAVDGRAALEVGFMGRPCIPTP